MAPRVRGRRAGGLGRWLSPSVGIKRWLIVVLVGQLFVALAGSLILRALYHDVAAGSPTTGSLLALVTLQWLPPAVRVGLLLVLGSAVFLYGLRRLLHVVLESFPAREEPLVELIHQKRSLARGPRIVAIGGGTGLSALLRGVKQVTSNITAVVAVADDGGSSGKLRAELGIAPVGDIRNCIAALADAEPVMTRLLQYRFPVESRSAAGLSGHAFGNLLIAALSAIEGDFEEGVRQSNRVLAVRGRVLPAAAEPLTLHAELGDGGTLHGQSVIARAAGIRRVWITPEQVRATGDALEAIATADLVLLGPGSLYTSLLPSLLVADLRAALASTAATRVYICNVATQVGETEGYGLADHLAALEDHGVLDLIDVVLANDNFSARAPANYPAAPVRLDLPRGVSGSPPRLVTADLVDGENAHRHDPRKLAAVLMSLQEERVPGRRPVSLPHSA